MITRNYFGKEQIVYYEKLKSGLEVYFAPNNNQSNYHIDLVVKYGSSIKEFIPVGKKDYLKLPLGVAHFLEHKMFDMENGDAFAFYSKTGTYINAGTSFFCTRYYIDGKTNIKKNLDYLLNMICMPYFTEEKTESEKGIIEEEIKMYDDEAEWILDYAEKKSVFSGTVDEKIAGTPESIKDITADILNDTYQTFYQPSNMFIVITGKFNKNVLEVIKNNKKLNDKITNQKIVIKKEKETKEVIKEYQLLEADIIIPKVSYTYKFDLDEYGKERSITRLYLNLLFTHLFGETSDFNEMILEKNIVSDYYMDHLSFDNIYTLTITAESEYADLFKDEVDKATSNINISEEDFERIKKTWLSIIIRSLDNKENLASSIIEDIIKDNEMTDQLELINKLKYQDLIKMINKLDLNNKTFIIMMPKENANKV